MVLVAVFGLVVERLLLQEQIDRFAALGERERPADDLGRGDGGHLDAKASWPGLLPLLHAARAWIGRLGREDALHGGQGAHF